jgi:hypothetical protein
VSSDFEAEKRAARSTKVESIDLRLHSSLIAHLGPSPLEIKKRARELGMIIVGEISTMLDAAGDRIELSDRASSVKVRSKFAREARSSEINGSINFRTFSPSEIRMNDRDNR